ADPRAATQAQSSYADFDQVFTCVLKRSNRERKYMFILLNQALDFAAKFPPVLLLAKSTIQISFKISSAESAINMCQE
ncbi:MAG: hypothetical protein K2X81_07190, partial [Candidatus Obscuribacterales bacterium]|nr:hypothetical protein [Candidatus Obscuribacterales bacterium]